MKSLVWALLLVIAVAAAIGGAVMYSLTARGLSTRADPSRVEVWLARTMRRLAIPAAARDRVNPVGNSQAVLDEAMGHFADHCASCHGNDGSGNTEMGRSFYPKAPDMRNEATQSMTDGELFSIIENGIRLTGMPAWGTGTPEGERASWGLVRFIRRLPRLTPEEILLMEEMNPRTPAQWREEEAVRRFLAGEDGAAEAQPHAH